MPVRPHTSFTPGFSPGNLSSHIAIRANASYFSTTHVCAGNLPCVHRPLRRSFTFWSGLLITTIIAWEWIQSGSTITKLQKDSWELQSSYSGVSLSYTARISPQELQFSRHHSYSRRDRGYVSDFFPPPHFLRGAGLPAPKMWLSSGEFSPSSYREACTRDLRYRSTRHWTCFVPYWPFFLTIFIPWSCHLVWRFRHLSIMDLTRPLTVVFWSCLSVMGILIWGWKDSVANNSKMPIGPLILRNADAGVSITYDPGPSSRRMRCSRFSTFGYSPYAHRYFLFPVLMTRSEHAAITRASIRSAALAGDPFATEYEPDSPRSFRKDLSSAFFHSPTMRWILFIPYWMILLFACAALTALSTWLLRRHGMASDLPQGQASSTTA